MSSQTKKIFSFLISLLLGIVLFIFVLRKVTLRDIFQTLSVFSLERGLIIFLFFLIGMIIPSWRWKLILQSQGYKVSLKKLFIAKLVGFSINYITPSLYTGGEVARVYVLKKETGIPLTPGFVSILTDELVDFMLGILFFTIGSFFLLSQFRAPNYILWFLFLVILVGTIFWIYFYTRIKRGKNPFSSIIKFFKLDRINLIKNNEGNIVKMERGIIDFFKYKKKTFFITFSLTILSLIVSLIQCWVILFFLNYNFSLGKIILIKLLLLLAGVIPIPGALGTLEATGALTFLILRLEAHIGISFVLVYRAFSLLLVALGIFFLFHLRVKSSKLFSTKNLDNNHNNQKS